ncbi:hypothetical protein GCM10029992_14360 [Glycomyces albus]
MTLAFQAWGLVKRFGATTALAGVDLSAEEGTVLGVLGPNGAGKTTAVRILATLLRPDEGTATVGGLDVVRRPGDVRRLIGLTGQFASVDADLTGMENLVLIGRLLDMRGAEAKARARELLADFDLSEAAGRTAGTYSGDAPPPRPGREPDGAPQDRVPRRADHRTGPGQARGAVGRGQEPGRRGRHGPADHPVPGRGRRARRRDLRDRLRRGHRARDPGGPEAARRRPAHHRPPRRPGPARRRRAGPVHRDRPRPDSPHRGVLSVPAESDRDFPAVVAELDRAGVAVTELALQLPDLDDVFFKLTGQGADDGKEAVAA